MLWSAEIKAAVAGPAAAAAVNRKLISIYTHSP